MTLMIPETSVNSSEMLALPPIPGSPAPYKDQQNALKEMNANQIDPHEVGQVITQL